MASGDALSPPGSASYSSNTMDVGDGTWVFTKNTFLLPNLVGLNFETMQYNGMGNRFSTVTEYHSLIKGHGVLAAITFLFIIPAAVMIARFYTGAIGSAIRYHAYLQILAVGFTTVVFILGFIAVGPNRALTNPHHGIGVAIYVLMLLQAIGGRLVSHIQKHVSFRVTVHQWSGRLIALLGIVQVPLGLTLYGSPKFTFVLYTLWMVFLLLLYFILNYRLEKRLARSRELYVSGARSEGGRTQVTEVTRRTGGGPMRWLAPAAAGAGLFAFLRRNRNRDRSPSRERSRSRMRSRSRGPEVVPSRHGSGSYVEEEKVTDGRRAGRGGGIMDKVLGVGAALGAGALLKGYMDRRERRRQDEEYSAVATDTPSRRGRLQRHGRPGASELSEETEVRRGDRRGPLLPGPGYPVVAGGALGAAEAGERRPGGPIEPITPRRSRRPDPSGVGTLEGSEYSSYVSPSRRPIEKKNDGLGKGLLAGIGLGWLAKRWQDRREQRKEDAVEEERYEDEQRRAGVAPPRYTGDGYPSPSMSQTRRLQRRPPPGPGRGPFIPGGPSQLSEVSSSEIEPRPPAPGYYGSGPPMPPLGPSGAPAPVGGGLPPVIPVPAPIPTAGGGAPGYRSRSRQDVVESATMPTMPPDPHGILHRESGSEEYHSAGGRAHRRQSSRLRAAEAAAAGAVAGAGLVAAGEAIRRRADGRSGDEAARQGESVHDSSSRLGQPLGIKVKAHNDRDRKMSVRRETPEETAARLREQQRRHEEDDDDLESSLSSAGSPSRSGRGMGGGRHYRREPSAGQRRAEAMAERMVERPRDDGPLMGRTLSPPSTSLSPAAAAAARRRPKDSAYYSGAAGPSGTAPTTPAAGPGQTVSSLGGSPGSHGTWSGMASPSPSGMPGRDASVAASASASAADRRRRRRLERRDPRQQTTVDFE